MAEHDQGMATDVAPRQPEARRNFASWLFILLAGVGLPAFTLGFEAFTHASGQSFVDPIPTLFHGFLIALVPLANAWVLVELYREAPRSGTALGRLHAFATGIAMVYALLYLPLTPLAPFALVFFGLGLLPLAPLLSLLAAWRGRTLLNRRLAEQGARLPRVWPGLALAVAALLVIDLPFTLTRIGLQMANSADPDPRSAGIRWLRAVGSEELLRELCYFRSGMSTDLIGMLVDLGDPVPPEAARKIYYQVTGTPFNTLPAPARTTWRDWRRGVDLDTGGTAVGNRLDGVSLASSRIDGTVDAAGNLAYLEWTLAFRNTSAFAQEGRAQIALPPGAVVSRLTLWIDGEAREAAFGSRARTRAAYGKVVSRQRDPVLVTTAGKDRILVQLFPIPPGGQEMKVRLGMTVPLAADDPSLARLRLPALVERNFDIPSGFTHAVWLEADSPLAGPTPLRQARADGNGHALRGEVADSQLGGPGRVIDIPRELPLQAAWSDDPRAPGKGVVQRWRQERVPAPKRVALVVDGSRVLAPLAGEIAAALAQFPPGLELGLFPATDAAPLPAAIPRQQAARALGALEFIGGQDNLAALTRAWDWVAEGASESDSGAIVWIHGPQPVLLGSSESLLQRLERQGSKVRLYPLEAVSGPNQVLAALDLFPTVTPVARSGSLQADLGRVFAAWAGGETRFRAVREQVDAGALPRERAGKTSDHLARLWAADEIRRLLAQGEGPGRQMATDLALRYQLVTPVSGAVVLETAQQYDEAGLAPVEKGSVPTVPEPEEWMLMAAVLLLLLWMARRRPLARPTMAA